MSTALWLGILACVIGAGGLSHLWHLERVEREALDQGIKLGKALANMPRDHAEALKAEALIWAKLAREKGWNR